MLQFTCLGFRTLSVPTEPITKHPACLISVYSCIPFNIIDNSCHLQIQYVCSNTNCQISKIVLASKERSSPTLGLNNTYKNFLSLNFERFKDITLHIRAIIISSTNITSLLNKIL